jgi:hypothetical protein
MLGSRRLTLLREAGKVARSAGWGVARYAGSESVCGADPRACVGRSLVQTPSGPSGCCLLNGEGIVVMAPEAPRECAR